MLKVSCALIIKQNKILLTQLGENSAHPLQWEFPGGKLNKNENAEECIKREIDEELNLTIEVKESLQPVIHDYGFRKIKLHPFLCVIRTGEMRLNEHIDYRWLTLDEMDETDLAEADRKLLSNGINRQFLQKHFREKMDKS